mgnify:CR=1 FL=1
MKQRSRSILIGLIISLVMLYLAFHKVDFAELLETVRQVSLPLLAVAVVVDLTRLYLPTLRWRVLLEPVQRIEITDLWHAVAIGFAVNNVLPLRAGEFTRAYVLGRKVGLSKTTVFTTIVVERMFDGLSLLVLAFVSLLLFPLPPDIRHYLLLASLMLLGLALAVLIVAFSPSRTERLANALARFLPARLRDQVRYKIPSMLAGFACLRNPVLLLKVSLWSLVIWFMEGTAFYFVAQALKLPLNYFASALTAIVTNLGIMVPSSPGFVGPFEFFTTHMAQAVARPEIVTAAQAASYALILHTVIFVPITMIGLYYLNLMHLKLSALAEASGEPQPQTAEVGCELPEASSEASNENQ